MWEALRAQLAAPASWPSTSWRAFRLEFHHLRPSKILSGLTPGAIYVARSES